MKKFLTIFLIAVGSFSFAQQPANEGSKNKPIKNNPVKKLKEQPATPDKIWKALFTDIQVKKVLGDNKTFVDAVPKFAPEIIFKKYNSQKNNSGFDLKNFVTENFFLLPLK
jgi:neutral trehalase